MIESGPKQYRLDPRQRFLFRTDLADPGTPRYVEKLLARLSGH
jgi:hypothetical protein